MNFNPSVTLNVVVLIALISCGQLAAQDLISNNSFTASNFRCSTPSINAIDDEFANRLETAYAEANLEEILKKSIDDELTIPVVFHIIHNGADENISETLILEGLEHVNQAFANTGYYDETTGVSIPIKFCLAQRDPEGNPTTGINRVESSLTEMNIEADDKALKALIYWETTEYINIWIVREICNNSQGCGVAGYATYPYLHGFEYDGIVAEAKYIGTSEANAGVLVHELGHYFGLYHTFEDGCDNYFCRLNGDRVCDTPPDNIEDNLPCDSLTNSCLTDVDQFGIDPDNPFSEEQNDLPNNYMDYRDFECYSAFTQGQSDRMMFFIDTVRNTLLYSDRCIAPCDNPVSALFETSKDSFFLNESWSANNLSTNADQFEWFIEGSMISNDQDLDYSFSELGRFEIQLCVSSSDSTCQQKCFSETIEVVCNTLSQISVEETDTDTDREIEFLQNNTAAGTYAWYINSELVSMDSTLCYTFEDAGYYEVYLIKSNGECEAKSNSIMMRVSLPCVVDSKYDYSKFKMPGISEMHLLEDSTIIIGGGKTTTLMDLELNPIWSFTTDRLPELASALTSLVLPDQQGFVFAGSFRSGNVRKAYIYRLSVDGELLWFKQSFGDFYDGVTAMTLNEKNEILAIGYSQSQTSKTSPYIRAFDLDGELKTARTYYTDWIYYEEEQPRYRAIEALDNGNYMMTGIIVSPTNSTGHTDIWACIVTILDKDLNVISTKYYVSQRDTFFAQHGHSLIKASDGTMILSHMTGVRGEDNQYSTLFKFDQDGELIKMVDLIYTRFSVGSPRITNLKDGNLLVFASNGDMIPIKMDLDLNIIWGRGYDIESGAFEYRNAIQLEDESLIFGCQHYDGSKTNTGILKADKNGMSNVCKMYIPPIRIEKSKYDILDEDLKSSGAAAGSFAFDAINWETFTHSLLFVNCPNQFTNRDYSINIMDAVVCDSIELDMEICFTGSSDSNFGKPCAVYSKNPSLFDVEPTFQFSAPDDLFNECVNIDLILDRNQYDEQVYIVLNDNGETDGLINFEQYSANNYSECNYYNNIDSAEVKLAYEEAFPNNMLTLCENDSLYFDFTQYADIIWQGNQSDGELTITEAGFYMIELTDLCGITQYDSLRVEQDLTALNIGMDTIICMGDSISLDIEGFEFYNWSPIEIFDCIDCSNVIIRPTTETAIYLSAINSEGCEFIDSLKIEFLDPIECISSVKELSTSSFEISPNPGAGVFTLSLNINNNEKTQLEIFNSSGQIIYNQNLNPAESIISLELKNATQGIYYCKIKNANFELVEKLVIAF